MPPANAKGTSAVNLSKGKPSHLVLTGPAGSFSEKTTVTSVVDLLHSSISFDGEALWKHGGTDVRLPVKLKGKGWSKDKDTTAPDSGSLSITLMSGPTVDPVPVTYVDDDSP
jgi:hypothetical protein